MKKRLILCISFILLLLMMVGCGSSSEVVDEQPQPSPTIQPTVEPTPEPTPVPEEDEQPVDEKPNEPEQPQPIEPPVVNEDLEALNPNEAGRIIVVMFHRFVEMYESGDKEYVMELDDFRDLLLELYENDFRLIRLNDYINGYIDVDAGKKPIVFTFDDGTASQFHFIKEEGQLKVSPDTAVGVMMAFNEQYPDFGLEGTFFVNFNSQTFHGEGTLQQRLEFLIDQGFEIGNHTYAHSTLSNFTDAEKLQEDIGKNQKVLYELIPDYRMKTFSLPYGIFPREEFKQYVYEGTYDGTEYKHDGVMLVSWDPAPSPFHKNFNPKAISRFRAPGIEPVQGDLNWWFDHLGENDLYVSDGDPHQIMIPENQKNHIDENAITNKGLYVY